MRRGVGIALAAGLVLAFAGFVGGLGLTVLGMVRVFDETTASGAGDPAALGSGIKACLMATMIGAPIGLVGVVLVIVALILHVTGRQR